jgi:hypothetical protein
MHRKPRFAESKTCLPFTAMQRYRIKAISSEICFYGYVPTEAEMLEGMGDPYTSPSTGCGGDYAYKLWLMKSVISFSIVLLAIVVVVRYNVAYKEKEKAIMHVTRHSDPPDISALNRQHRRERFREFLSNIVLAILQSSEMEL